MNLPNADAMLNYYASGTEQANSWGMISKVLNSLNLDFKLSSIATSPALTTYTVQMFNTDFVPKVSRIEKALRVLLCSAGVRVDISNGFSVQVPNENRQTIGIREVLQQATPCATSLPIFLGIDSAGDSIVFDLAKAPHLLVGGATGSGKSVCINTIIASLLLMNTPNELELHLIDPKVVEFSKYQGLSHLKHNVINEVSDAIDLLNELVQEMERRYSYLSSQGYNSIDDYPCFPRSVVIIDELADLMLIGGKEIQKPLTRLLQKARACGIHIVLATQNPNIKVVPGIVKANCPSRIAFRTSSITDSKVILDYGGADKLLGKGDGLLKTATNPNFVRFQNAFVSDEEIKRIVEHWKEKGSC